MVALVGTLVPSVVVLVSEADAGPLALWLHAVPVGSGLVALFALKTLRHRSMLVQDALDATQSAIVVYDKDDRLVLANRRYREALGVPDDAFVPGVHYGELLRLSLPKTMPEPEIEKEFERRLALQSVADGRPSDRLYPGHAWLRVTKTRTPQGSNVGVAIDVTELYELRERLEREARRFTALAEGAPVGICQVDEAGKILFVNDALLGMLGAADLDDLAGGAHAFTLGKQPIAGFRELVRVLLATPPQGELQLCLESEAREFLVKTAFVEMKASLDRMLPPERRAGENILIFVDLSERVKAEAKIRFLAHHDPLTGAGNRVAFVQDLRAAVAEADTCHPVSIVTLDLDRFKPVNDAYGHSVGDRLLTSLVARLQALLTPRMAIYRLGGDEFVILSREAADFDVLAFARRAVARVESPVRIAQHDIVVGASAGVSVWPRDATEEETLLHYADLALYQVKRSGGGDAMAFDRTILSSTNDRRLMEVDLVDALENHDFRIVFQPVYGLDRKRAIGVETLARWRNRRTGEDIPPSTFISLAEDTSLIQRIDFEVLDKAVAQFGAWSGEGITLDTVLVNMSARTLEAPGTVERIAEILMRRRVSGRSVVIELTESFAMRSVGGMLQTIRGINNLGVRFAIDDFGTGYTSLRLLADLPISFLKIDQSFVRDLTAPDHEGALAVVRAIIDMASHMDLCVIAEGVETEAQFEILKALGCIRFQGYLFSRPVPAQGVTAMLAPAE
ncbi:putative bifunctional diguanylate cyclase/phosphodiesterase [Acuticoccus kandeliae]|uniref:putative bifunctional diguanylate cyclase/phosphodiesterase n=1 Tax=Acuticoccus kandeliae TaxID=2073160 RepID=UPI001FEC090A|nr:EAL domain-containing protein [Acuticoccus kandeliae]